MIITQIELQANYKLRIFARDGRIGLFDVSPYLNSDAFTELKDNANFIKIQNGKYFIQWDCGADLSADTIESEWQLA